MPRVRKDTQPISAAPGQTYGERGAQEAAQQVMPMAGDPFGAAEAFNPQAQPLSAPAPDGPIEAGLPTGPGAGPEALGVPNRQTNQVMRASAGRTLAMLTALHQNQPLSPATVMFMRKLRAKLGADFNMAEVLDNKRTE